jgi:hypothetical protein
MDSTQPTNHRHAGREMYSRDFDWSSDDVAEIYCPECKRHETVRAAMYNNGTVVCWGTKTTYRYDKEQRHGQ